MHYRTSSDFEYHVYRRPSFIQRIRRSIRHFYRDSRTTVFMVFLATVVGIGIFATLEWYMRLLDAGLNAAVDSEYHRVGIDPTGDRREDAEFRRRAQEYRDIKAGRGPGGGDQP